MCNHISKLSGKLPSEQTSLGLLASATVCSGQFQNALDIVRLGSFTPWWETVWIKTHNFHSHGFRSLPIFCFYSDVLNWIWEASQCHAKILPKSMLVNFGLANAIPMLFCWVLQTSSFLPLCFGSNTAWSSSVLVQHVLGGVPDTHRHQVALYFLSEQKQHHRLSNLRQIIFYFDPRLRSKMLLSFWTTN